MYFLPKEYLEIMTILTHCANVHITFACTQRHIYICDKSKFSTRQSCYGCVESRMYKQQATVPELRISQQCC
jgi:hypothetical protein